MTRLGHVEEMASPDPVSLKGARRQPPGGEAPAAGPATADSPGQQQQQQQREGPAALAAQPGRYLQQGAARAWQGLQQVQREGQRQEHAALAGAERPLVYPLLGACAALWWLCVGAGLLLHAGALPTRMVRETHWLPLLGFDLWLRTWGVLIAAPVLGLRFAANQASGQQAAWLAARSGHHFQEALVLYGGLAAGRVAVYFCHAWYRVLKRGYHKTVNLVRAGEAKPVPDVMSDHLFLASCIAAVLTGEMCLAYVELRRSRRPPLRQWLLVSALAYAGLVYVLLCGDMLFTARFFHGRPETLAGACLGLFFPALVVAWLLTPLRAKA